MPCGQQFHCCVIRTSFRTAPRECNTTKATNNRPCGSVYVEMLMLSAHTLAQKDSLIGFSVPIEKIWLLGT